MKAIQACSPQSSSFLDPTSLTALTENYYLDYSSLPMEAKLAKRTLATNIRNLETISDVIQSVYPLCQAFPTFAKATTNSIDHVSCLLSVNAVSQP